MKKEKVPFKKSFKNNMFILSLAFKNDKLMVIMRLIMGFFTGLNHGATVFFISKILNALDSGERVEHIMLLIFHLEYISSYFICNLLLGLELFRMKSNSAKGG